MNIRQVQKHKNRIDSFRKLIYPRISNRSEALVDRFLVNNLVVADFIPSAYVSEFKSVVVESKNLIFFNSMEGADTILIRDYPGIFSRVECSTENLKETIDIISFIEKSIEVRGKSKKFRCIKYGKVNESLETKALIYDQSSILQGLVTEDTVRNICEFVEEYSLSENRGDSYKKCKDYLSQVCKEYLYYSVLNFVKTISEKSCLYLLDNTHLINRGEEVLTAYENPTKTR